MNIKKYAIIDLHFHLDGSLSVKSVLEVAKKENISLPTYNVDELQNLLSVPENCQSLNEYLERFDLPNLVLQTKEGLKICTLDILKRLSNQGLKYVEIRMAPQLSTDKRLTQKEVVATLIETLKEGEKFGIYSNLILCMMRGADNKAKNLETVKVAKEFLGKGVVALDLAGAEALFPNEMFDEEFKLANKYNIPLTIHSGEAAGPESVMSALKYNPVRIGHGVHSIDDEKVLELLKKRGICLEICPKSNIDTKTYSSYSELPIRALKEYGIKISINTDDMTVSNTNLEQEYQTLIDLGFNEKELQEFARNSIEASFANKDIKEKLFNYIK